MLPSVPLHRRLVIIGHDRLVFHSVLLEMVEQVRVAAVSERLQLIVVPLLLEHLFDVAVLHATLRLHK